MKDFVEEFARAENKKSRYIKKFYQSGFQVMKSYKNIVNEAKQKSVIDKIQSNEKITMYEYKTYKNMLDDFAKINKMFDKITSNASTLRTILGDENYAVLEKTNRILNYKGLPGMALAKGSLEKKGIKINFIMRS